MVASAYTVIVPAYNAGDTLDDCLTALRAAKPAPAEIVLCDDGSTDDTAEIARSHGVRVVRGATARQGAGAARNAAARHARTSRILFVDADVVIEPCAPRRLLAALGDGVVAAFGAYGDRPRVRRFAGRYANLRHHHAHVTAPREAETFWTGLGAVDRGVFERVGGFDEASPLEDVEIGPRLRRHGRVRIVPEAVGHHLKDWTLAQLWRTDVLVRAVPWSSMMAAGHLPPTMNAARAEQAKSGLAHACWLLAALAALFFSPTLAAAAAAALLAYLWLNRAFLGLLAQDSVGLAVAGAGLHLAYHVYASATCTLVLVGHGMSARVKRRPSRGAAQPAR